MEMLILSLVVFYIIYKCHTYKGNRNKKKFKNIYKDEDI